MALLVAYGASGCPYLALETVAALARPKRPEPTARCHAGALRQGVGKGLLKVMSKMGISTLQSYCGAQLWEAVGLSELLVERHFAGTPSRVGGIDMDLIAAETLRRHRFAFEDAFATEGSFAEGAPTFGGADGDARLDPGGEYQYRVQGEHHNWNPMTIAKLQHATRGDSYSTFKEFSALANDETRRQSTLRGLLDFVEREPVPLDEVEPASAIRDLALARCRSGRLARKRIRRS